VTLEGGSQPDGGALFSLTPSGKFALLHTFAPGPQNNDPNGDNPVGPIEGPDGRLYGTTSRGGQPGYWVLFRINKNGSGFQILHEFCSSANCADGGLGVISVLGTDGSQTGAFPWALIQINDGTYRGTTTGYGAASSGHFGDGVVFSLNAGLPPR